MRLIIFMLLPFSLALATPTNPFVTCHIDGLPGQPKLDYGDYEEFPSIINSKNPTIAYEGGSYFHVPKLFQVLSVSSF